MSLLLAVTYPILSSDGRLHLIHADRSFGKIIDGQKVRYLVGNVEAYQDTLKMYCDEAIFYEDQNLTEFNGNVLIDDSHHRLWADKIIYNTETRIANCLGHVRISGQKDSLYAEKFIYAFRSQNAEAEKNVYLWDKESNAIVTGDAAHYIADLNESHVSGNAYFAHHQRDQADTMMITSEKMAYYGLEPKRAVAEKNVRIFKGNVQATCDSATYFVTDESVALRIDPVAWQEESRMKGLKIDFILDSLEIKEIFLTDKAEITTLADTLENKYNILRGRSIQVSMINQEPDKIIARNNAISIYRVEENKVKQGTNSASADSIMVYFFQGEADSIAIMGGIEGIFYPADWKGEIKSEY